MAGITGIFAPGKKKEVEKMLNKISHRGLKGKAILELKEATFRIEVARSMSHRLPMEKRKDGKR